MVAHAPGDKDVYKPSVDWSHAHRKGSIEAFAWCVEKAWECRQYKSAKRMFDEAHRRYQGDFIEELSIDAALLLEGNGA